MSVTKDKEVQEALLAIKKLVELSDGHDTSSDAVLTLDNVVWRNPVSDEAEEIAIDEGDSLRAASPSYSQSTSSKPKPSHAEPSHGVSSSLDSAPFGADKASDYEGHKELPLPASSLSVSARDLADMGKPKPHTPITTPITAPVTVPIPSLEAKDELATQLVNSQPFETQVRPAQAKMSQEPSIAAQPSGPLLSKQSEDVTELTTPIGRKGGGFYSRSPADGPNADKPLIQTKAQPYPELADQQSALEARIPISRPAIRTKESEQPVSDEAAMPAITDFHGMDFNFSAAEGLMSPSSFEEMAQSAQNPITPEVNVPVAEPALEDPVMAVQAMYQAQDSDDSYADETVSSGPLSTGQPNLHIVSDQSASDEEEEGFSGAVRLALRSIIKEQVSHWLQGNMTGLIEDALSTPQKRPSQSSKPTSKKR